MFRVKTNVYATQFHPEADPAGFMVRIQTYGSHGYFRPDEARRLIEAVSQEETPVPRAMLARFVDRYRA
jgi:GMP synthase (glutamine-hydrolysing)